MNGKNNIIFFYPSRVVGGAEYLFLRTAGELLKRKYNVYYIDYKDGFARKELEGSGVIFLDYEKKLKTAIDVEGVLITPISNFYRITDYVEIKREKTKLFFWSLHPYNIVHVIAELNVFSSKGFDKIKKYANLFFKKKFNYFKKILSKLNDKKSLVFMDYANYIDNKKLFDIEFSKDYLPIMSPLKEKTAKTENVNKDEINICVLGRLCVEKTYPLMNVLENLYRLKTDKRKVVHIIGEGECRKFIDVKKYEKEMEIVFAGTVRGGELDDYIISRCDILFTMGTSALEGAALKIPVVYTDLSYSEFFSEEFSYLFNKHNLGFISRQDDVKKSFSSIINDIYDKGKKPEIGESCYEYYVSYHSPDSVVNKLLGFIKEDTLDYRAYADIKKDAGPEGARGIKYKIIKKIF